VRIDHGDLKDDNFDDEGQMEIAIWPHKTGSTYISESVIDISKIPTAGLRFPTTASSRKLSLSDSYNDRQPEMAAETCLHVWNYSDRQHGNSNGKFGIFHHGELNKKCSSD